MRPRPQSRAAADSSPSTASSAVASIQTRIIAASDTCAVVYWRSHRRSAVELVGIGLPGDVGDLVEGDRGALERPGREQAHDLVLVVEVAVERAVRQAGRCGDVVDARAVVAARDEHHVRSIEQAAERAGTSGREVGLC